MAPGSKKKGKKIPSGPVADKPCHNCRRRRLRCDRQLPHCAKCDAKGVECLGYSQIFQWTGAVASRGRLAGQQSSAALYSPARPSTVRSRASLSSVSSLSLPTSPSPADLLEMDALSINDPHQYQTISHLASSRHHTLNSSQTRADISYSRHNDGVGSSHSRNYQTFHSLAAPNTTPTLSPTAYETSPTPRFHQYVSNPASCSTVGGVDSESFRFSFSEDFAPTGVNDTPSLAVPALCRDPSASPSPISDQRSVMAVSPSNHS